jgi:hypothetical protein
MSERRSAIDCPHERTVPRCWRGENGFMQARLQCKDCGHYGKYGYKVPSKAQLIEKGFSPDPASLPPFDDVAFMCASEELSNQKRDEIMAKRLEVLIESADNDNDHSQDPYYKTEEWHAKRRLVIERAGGLCEGCGKNEAVQAHHLHYRTFKREFLWDLKAVCRECHERVHAIQKENKTAVVEQLKHHLGKKSA